VGVGIAGTYVNGRIHILHAGDEMTLAVAKDFEIEKLDVSMAMESQGTVISTGRVKCRGV
jgi:hypothetical protein